MLWLATLLLLLCSISLCAINISTFCGRALIRPVRMDRILLPRKGPVATNEVSYQYLTKRHDFNEFDWPLCQMMKTIHSPVQLSPLPITKNTSVSTAGKLVRLHQARTTTFNNPCYLACQFLSYSLPGPSPTQVTSSGHLHHVVLFIVLRSIRYAICVSDLRSQCVGE